MEKKVKRKSFWDNYAVISVFLSLVFLGFIIWVYKWQTIIFFLLIEAIAVFFLEAVNYIEHYGLRRKKLENGQY